MADTINPEVIERMYKYHSAEATPLKKADGLFVFGRADSRVADKTAELLRANMAEYALFVGGVGKDSGPLAQLNPPLPESIYLASMTRWGHDIPDNRLHVEPKPTNGGECCRMGLEYITNNGLPHNRMTVVIHPTSLRRIRAMLDLIAPQKGFKAEWQGTGTGYVFDSENPVDQKEAVAELLRVWGWPDHKNAEGKSDPWCAPQADLPQDLVEHARRYDAILNPKK